MNILSAAILKSKLGADQKRQRSQWESPTWGGVLFTSAELEDGKSNFEGQMERTIR